MPSSVSNRTVAQLKDELKRRGLSTKGLKAELEERLEQAENEDSQPQTSSTISGADVGTGTTAVIAPPSSNSTKDDLEKEQEVTKSTEAADIAAKGTSSLDEPDDSSTRKKKRVKVEDTGSNKGQIDAKRIAPESDLDFLHDSIVEVPEEVLSRIPSLEKELSSRTSRQAKVRLLLDFVTRDDSVSRRAARQYIRQTLFLFESSSLSSFEERLLYQECLPESEDDRPEDAQRRFFERAGLLQRICFALSDRGVPDAERVALEGAPSQSVSLAMSADFFVKNDTEEGKPQVRKLFEKALGVSAGVSDETLIRALKEYFGPRKSIAELISSNVFERELSPLPEDDANDTREREEVFELIQSRPASTLLSLIARFVFLLKYDICFPRGRGSAAQRVFTPNKRPDDGDVDSMLDEVILIRENNCFRIASSKNLQGFKSNTVDFCHLENVLDLDMVRQLNRLQHLGTTSDKGRRRVQLSKLLGSVLSYSNPNQDDAKMTVPSASLAIDFGPNAVIGGFSRLKECFPGELERLIVEQEGEDGDKAKEQQEADNFSRFVVTFPKKIAIGMRKRQSTTAGTASSSVVPPLSISQIQALRQCLSSSSTSTITTPAVVYVPPTDSSHSPFDDDNSKNLVAQLIATLFVAQPQHSTSRILVVSGNSETDLVDLLKRARQRSDHMIDLKDIVVIDDGEEDHERRRSFYFENFFSIKRTTQRHHKERTAVLQSCLELARKLQVDDPEQSAKSCDFASYFLTKARQIVVKTQPNSTELKVQIEQLQTKVQELCKFELLAKSSVPGLMREFLYQVQCRIVGTTTTKTNLTGDDEPLDIGRFDYIVCDHISKAQDLLLAAAAASATSVGGNSSSSSVKAIFVFGDQPSCQFKPTTTITALSKREASLSTITDSSAHHLAGFLSRFVHKQVASLKEEGDYVVALYAYALKVGYSQHDLQVVSLTSKQAQTVEELFKKQQQHSSSHGLFPSNIPLPVCVSESGLARRKLTFVSVGGRDFSQNLLDLIARNSKQGLFVFTCDKKWVATIPATEAMPVLKHDNASSSANVELVLGERVNEPFDQELRDGTKFAIQKPADFVSVIANM